MSTSPSSRRQFLRQSAQLAGAGALGVPLLGANAVVDDGVRELTSEELIDARTQGAIDKGLRFLASRQI
ncbi:MAG: twin-arginine translocation signal domain-containing protein, partial [Verrucomicrobiales bacterium]